jgi:hypothetical protein
VAAAGGPPRQLTFRGGLGPKWRPDGRAITFYDREAIWNVSPTGGEPELVVNQREISGIAWSETGELYYKRLGNDGSATLWRLDRDGTSHRVLHADDPVRRWVRADLVADGQRIVLPLTEYEADLWLVELD